MFSQLGDLHDQLDRLSDVLAELRKNMDELSWEVDSLQAANAQLEGGQDDLLLAQEYRNQALKEAWTRLTNARLLGQDYREEEAWNQLTELINHEGRPN